MTTLITGANGQLGLSLATRAPNALLAARSTLDITDEDAVSAYIHANNITNIINCAAYTAVDHAEDDIAEAEKNNITGPLNLAKTGIPLIHISTDYVFDGHNYKPYTEDDSTNPLSVYGRTKKAGEDAILNHAKSALILRTSWLYSEYGHNFLKTIHKLASERASLNIVADQTGTPTYAGDLADIIIKLMPHIHDGQKDIYHITNEGTASWYDFAHAINQQSGLTCAINPIESKDYPTKATRPFYSVLNKAKIKQKLDITIPHWTEGLNKCLKHF